jgi:o-succinylbenzoate synthase
MVKTIPALKVLEIHQDLPPACTIADLDNLVTVAPPSVRFGLETLMADLYSRALGVPLRQAWFDSHQTADQTEINYLLTNDQATISQQVDRLLEEGVTTFKLKVGRNSRAEISIIEKIRKQIGVNCRLRLDANRAFDLEEADLFLQSIEGLAIEYIEEPVRTPTVETLQRLASSHSTPIALDETIAEWRADNSSPLSSFIDDELVKSGCFQMAILKPAILGGLREVHQLIDALDSEGIQNVITSSLDCGIGVTAAAQIAGAHPDKLLACGLATSGRLETSLGARNLQISRGSLIQPTEPGLGMEVDIETNALYLQEISL